MISASMGASHPCGISAPRRVPWRSSSPGRIVKPEEEFVYPGSEFPTPRMRPSQASVDAYGECSYLDNQSEKVFNFFDRPFHHSSGVQVFGPQHVVFQLDPSIIVARSRNILQPQQPQGFPEAPGG